MYLGNTMEEKRDSVNELRRRAKRLGKIFGVCGIFFALVYLYTAFLLEGSIFAKLFMILCGIAVPFMLYFYGFILYFGFIAVKSWFVKRDISASDMASAAGTTLAVSYLLGGKKTVKTSAFVMFLIFGLAFSIGWFVGLYNYLTMRKYLNAQPA